MRESDESREEQDQDTSLCLCLLTITWTPIVGFAMSRNPIEQKQSEANESYMYYIVDILHRLIHVFSGLPLTHFKPI